MRTKPNTLSRYSHQIKHYHYASKIVFWYFSHFLSLSANFFSVQFWMAYLSPIQVSLLNVDGIIEQYDFFIKTIKAQAKLCHLK